MCRERLVQNVAAHGRRTRGRFDLTSPAAAAYPASQPHSAWPFPREEVSAARRKENYYSVRSGSKEESSFGPPHVGSASQAFPHSTPCDALAFDHGSPPIQPSGQLKLPARAGRLPTWYYPSCLQSHYRIVATGLVTAITIQGEPRHSRRTAPHPADENSYSPAFGILTCDIRQIVDNVNSATTGLRRVSCDLRGMMQRRSYAEPWAGTSRLNEERTRSVHDWCPACDALCMPAVHDSAPPVAAIPSMDSIDQSGAMMSHA